MLANFALFVDLLLLPGLALFSLFHSKVTYACLLLLLLACPLPTRIFISILQVLRMPHCYFVNDYRQSGLAAIRSPAPVRSDYGLPSGGDEERGSGDVADDRRQRDDGEPGVWGHAGEQGSSVEQDQRQGLVGSGVDCVVLCNFNRLHKIDPHTFAAWMEVCWCDFCSNIAIRSGNLYTCVG